jgi:Tfp pilus assembly protein PilX
MYRLFKQKMRKKENVQGFVLPFTLLICAIMLLISVGISTVLMKQIYFSNLSRESQAAYYAADNALACAVSIEETYVYNTSGIFPYDPFFVTTSENILDMNAKIVAINAQRAAIDPPESALAPTLADVKCAQSEIFNTSTTISDFTVDSANFVRKIDGQPDELGKTSNFKMKMRIADGEYRCAKVTINKTATYKQIIARGYSRCDRPNGTIERAVVYTTVQ